MVSNNSKKSAFQRLIDWIAIPEETDDNNADIDFKNESISETSEIYQKETGTTKADSNFNNQSDQETSVISLEELDKGIRKYGQLYNRILKMANSIWPENTIRGKTIEYTVTDRSSFDLYKQNFNKAAENDPEFINYLLNNVDFTEISHERHYYANSLKSNLKDFYDLADQEPETQGTSIPEAFNVADFRKRERELTDNIVRDIKLNPYTYVNVRLKYKSNMGNLHLEHTQQLTNSQLYDLLSDEHYREEKELDKRLNTVVGNALNDFIKKSAVYSRTKEDIYLYIGIKPFVLSDKYISFSRNGSYIFSYEKADEQQFFSVKRKDLYSHIFSFLYDFFEYTSENTEDYPPYRFCLTCGNPEDFALFSTQNLDDKYNLVVDIKFASFMEKIPQHYPEIKEDEQGFLNRISKYEIEDIGILVIAKFKYEREMIDSFKNVLAENGYPIDKLSFNTVEMTGYKFEEYCAALLKSNGFENVRVTKGSGDQGIDIIAYRFGVKYGIQCKYFDHPVGNKAVQEAYAGKRYYDCHVAAVLTNSTFTPQAVSLAKKSGVVLWDKDFLNNLEQNQSFQ